MAKPKQIKIKESKSYLKKKLKQAPPIFIPRLRMLLALKESPEGLSKRVLADLLGVNHNSIQSWRKLYETKGLSALLSHGKIGFKPSVISKTQHEHLKKILTNPENGIQGYKELQLWFEQEHQAIAYTTLLGYCTRHFKTKIKVARKSNVNKDPKAVETFKKTLLASLETV